MEYEYMALPPEDGYAGQCRAAVRNKELADKGWKNWRMIPWYESGIVSICVVRRELRPKDEPRMWTKAEIEGVAKGMQGSVLNERVMRADLCGRLEKRNAELQAAIEAVVKTERSPGPVLEDHHYDAIRGAIHKYLYPLATKTTVAHGSNWTIKEESNG